MSNLGSGSDRKERGDARMSFFSVFCLVMSSCSTVFPFRNTKTNKAGGFLLSTARGVTSTGASPGNPCLLLYTHQKCWSHCSLLPQDAGAPTLCLETLLTQLFQQTVFTQSLLWRGWSSLLPLWLLESSLSALEYSWALYCPFVFVPTLFFSLNGLLGVFITFSVSHDLYQPWFSSAKQARLFSLFLYSIINHQLFN